MSDPSYTPLLLLDNSNMMSILNQGEFKCTNLSFAEAKAILEMHDESDILRCFTDNNIGGNHLQLSRYCQTDFAYKHIRICGLDRTPLFLSPTSPHRKPNPLSRRMIM